MGLNSLARSNLGFGQQAAQQFGRISAPLGGVNTIDSLAKMNASDCIYSFNISPAEKGLQVRKGYQQWRTGLSGPVRTLIPFYSDDPTQNALFAVTNIGIYDVTASGAVGAILLSFGTTTGASGWGVFTHHINDAGVRTLFYADEVNGLFEYVAGGSWAQTTAITGLNETDVRFVMVHKQRLWVIDKFGNSFYLPVLAKAGAATLFIWGSKFKRGGMLVGLYNWTVDGGIGVDDYLIGLSRGGDVLVYSGEDPSSSTTWVTVGLWYAGQIPEGRRVASAIGGSLHILSAYGIVDIAALIASNATAEDVTDPTTSSKIAPALRSEISTYSTSFGWDIVPVLSEGAAIITRPLATSVEALQFVQHTGLGSWSFWRGPRMNCAVEYDRHMYFGDESGTVHLLTGGKDGVLLNGTGGVDVEFSFLTAFSDLEVPAINKQPVLFNATFLNKTGTKPVYDIKARFDYDFSEVPFVSGGPAMPSGSLWDTALWDSAMWGGSPGIDHKIEGSFGLGRNIAIAMRGTSIDQATFLDCDVIWVSGGPL